MKVIKQSSHTEKQRSTIVPEKEKERESYNTWISIWRKFLDHGAWRIIQTEL